MLNNYYKSIISLAIPIIIGQVGTMITGLADTIMVGQHSTAELAASAFVNNVFMFFMVFGIGFTFNFTPLVSNCLAQGNKYSIGELLKNSLLVNTVLGFVLAFLMGLIYLNLEKMGQPDELLVYIKPYFVVYGLSIIPMMIYTTYRQFVETVLQPATSMWIFLIAIPSGYILGFVADLNIVGIWLAFPIGFIFASLAFFIRFKKVAEPLN